MASKDLRPHLTELTQHNNPPSESELQEAFELRSKLQEDLLQVDTEIRRLKEQRAAIQKSVDTYNDILSPARRLLPDILREIFYHCLPDDRNPTSSAKEAPILLTRICSIWRAIALTSPLIWARIHIALPGNPSLSFGTLSSAAITKRHLDFSKVMELRCQVVKDWLTRSGTRPLSISLSHPIGFNDHEAIDDWVDESQAYDVTEPLFQQIVSFSPRWKHVELSMPFSVYKKLQSHISEDSLPLLNSLKGDIGHNNWDDMFLEHPDSLPVRFLEAPNLRRLSLHSSQLPHNTMILLPIWNRLTDLHIQSRILNADFLNVVKLCQNLVTCQVDHLETSLRFVPPQTEAIIPTLQMIRINELGLPSDVIRAINAPNLKSLEYRFPARLCDHGPRLMRADVLLIFVERGASMLRKLTLVPQNLRPEDMVTCLHLANGVSHLVLKCGSYSYVDAVEDDALGSDFFDLHLLTIHINSGSRDILLPKLEVLEVDDIRQFKDEDILHLLTSRMDAARRGDVSPLRRLKLQFTRRRQRDIREEASELAKSSGYELSLQLDYRPDGLPYNGRLSPSYGTLPISFGLREPWPPVIL